jgi:hypothetical protein
MYNRSLYFLARNPYSVSKSIGQSYMSIKSYMYERTIRFCCKKCWRFFKLEKLLSLRSAIDAINDLDEVTVTEVGGEDMQFVAEALGKDISMMLVCDWFDTHHRIVGYVAPLCSPSGRNTSGRAPSAPRNLGLLSNLLSGRFVSCQLSQVPGARQQFDVPTSVTSWTLPHVYNPSREDSTIVFLNMPCICKCCTINQCN